MVRGIQTLQAVQKGGMRYWQNPRWIFFTNAQTANCQRRSLWVHREHAVIWVICEGYISRCNEDARQGMSAKNHIKAAGMTPSLFISQSLRYGMTRVKCSTFALGKTLFFTKKRFLYSCNAQNFATRQFLSRNRWFISAGHGKRPTFLHLHSTVLCCQKMPAAWTKVVVASGVL